MFRAFRPQSHQDLRDSAWLPGSEMEKCAAPEWLLKERERFLRPSLPSDFRLKAFVFHDDTIPLPGIEASVIPLFPTRTSRPTFNGPNLSAEFFASVDAGKEYGIAASVTPGWVGALDDYKHLNGRFYLYEGYVKVGYGRFEGGYGRTSLGFGSAKHGSLILSGNSKPMNVYRAGLRPSPDAFLGSLSIETWLAIQDQTAGVMDAKLWGVGLGLRPFDFLELAALEIFQFGGQGAPGLEIKDYFKMLPYGDDGRHNRRLALQVGVWGPSKHFKVYVQTLVEKLTRLENWFFDDVSFLAGVWFPKVSDMEFRAEYVRTSPRIYSDAFWTQGMSYQRTPLGHSLGNDGEGVYFDAGLKPLLQWRPTLTLYYESRQKKEWRYGISAELKRRMGNWEGAVAGNVGRVLNHGYENGDDINVAAASISFRYSL